MSEFMRIIKERRSIRKYEPNPIPDEMLHTVLESVQWAPSWANTQCWEVILVKDPEIKKQLQDTIAPKNPATKAIVAAPVVIALCGKLNASGFYNGNVTTKFGDWFMFDLGIATQNICLTAHHLGLGTVIVGLFDHEKAASVLQIPEGFELVTLIPIGFPAQTGKAPNRKSIQDFVHYDRF